MVGRTQSCVQRCNIAWETGRDGGGGGGGGAHVCASRLRVICQCDDPVYVCWIIRDELVEALSNWRERRPKTQEHAELVLRSHTPERHRGARAAVPREHGSPLSEKSDALGAARAGWRGLARRSKDKTKARPRAHSWSGSSGAGSPGLEPGQTGARAGNLRLWQGRRAIRCKNTLKI